MRVCYIVLVATATLLASSNVTVFTDKDPINISDEPSPNARSAAAPGKNDTRKRSLRIADTDDVDDEDDDDNLSEDEEERAGGTSLVLSLHKIDKYEDT